MHKTIPTPIYLINQQFTMGVIWGVFGVVRGFFKGVFA